MLTKMIKKRLVCKQMAQMHRIKVIWPESDEYDRMCEQTASFAKLAKWIPEISNNCPTDKQFEVLERIFAFLRQQIINFRLPIVFCHNDLLGYNILSDKPENDVSFIDYEYAGMNFQLNDFGNLFWEYSGEIFLTDF